MRQWAIGVFEDGLEEAGVFIGELSDGVRIEDTIAVFPGQFHSVGFEEDGEGEFELGGPGVDIEGAHVEARELWGLAGGVLEDEERLDEGHVPEREGGLELEVESLGG